MARVGGVAPPLLVAQRTPECAGEFRVPPFTGVSALAPSPFLAAAARLAAPSGEAVSAPTVAATPPRSVRRDLLKDFECHVHEPRSAASTFANVVCTSVFVSTRWSGAFFDSANDERPAAPPNSADAAMPSRIDL